MGAKILHQQQRARLDTVPSVIQAEEAVRGVVSREAVGPDKFPAELIKLLLDGDQVLIRKFRFIVVVIWRSEDVPQP